MALVRKPVIRRITEIPSLTPGGQLMNNKRVEYFLVIDGRPEETQGPYTLEFTPAQFIPERVSEAIQKDAQAHIAILPAVE